MTGPTAEVMQLIEVHKSQGGVPALRCLAKGQNGGVDLTNLSPTAPDLGAPLSAARLTLSARSLGCAFLNGRPRIDGSRNILVRCDLAHRHCDLGDQIRIIV